MKMIKQVYFVAVEEIIKQIYQVIRKIKCFFFIFVKIFFDYPGFETIVIEYLQ